MFARARAAPLLVVSLALTPSACLSCERVCDIQTNADFLWASDCDLLVVDDTEMADVDGVETVGPVFSAHVTDNSSLTDVSALGELSAPILLIARNASLDAVELRTAGGTVTLLDGVVRVLDIESIRSDLDLFIRVPRLDRVALAADADVETTVHFAGAIPADAAWNASEIGLRALRVSGVPDATADVLAPLGVPSDFVGIYGSGAMQPNTAGVDTYDAGLRAAGFNGTLEVCVALCDSQQTPCDDDGRRRLPCDVR